MGKRVICGAIALLAALALFWVDRFVGGVVLGFLGVLLAAGGLAELFSLGRRAGLQPFTGIGVLVGGLLLPYAMIMPSAARGVPSPETLFGLHLIPFILLFLMLLFAASRRPGPLRPQLGNVSFTAFGVLYMAVPLMFLARTRLLDPDGWGYVLLIVAVAEVGDIGAYFTGKGLGRHKLAPRISPNKTVEGAIGGLAASMLAAALVAWIFRLEGLTQGGIFPIMAFGALVGIAGQAGDLTASFIKRCAEAKDSGGVLPAMGGVLDLIDCLLVAGPVGYCILVAWLRI